jgi:excinuclease ABC subunit C
VAGREDEPIALERRSPVLRVIQQIRDESHRFAINFHRERRGRRTMTSELNEISGIGLKTTQKLLSHFGSLARLREASIDELQVVVTKVQAQAVWKHFH